MLSGLSLRQLRGAYRSGALELRQVADHVVDLAERYAAHNIWITPPSEALLAPFLETLSASDMDTLPLWGVPFAIKDNIDLAGTATTAACPAFAYTPARSATVVERLIAAGALPVGKTNLDQFATGLVGTRSPYGATTHPLRPEHISGGSSSGSAVAVATGMASFALGTDTAGSGRVPAAFNALVGLKPSRGLLPCTGVVPACRSLDCVSIFAGNAGDAAAVAALCAGPDGGDGMTRRNPHANRFEDFGIWNGPLTLGVAAPEALTFFGDEDYAAAYAATLERLRETSVELTTIDYRSFAAAGRELYQGPWISERFITAQRLLEESPGALLDVTRTIIAPGGAVAATELLQSIYRLAELRREACRELQRCDALLTPTAPRQLRIDEVAAEPIASNSQLGYYSNGMNLLDLCGVALPGVATDSGRPFGITLVGDRFTDSRLLAIAARLEVLLTPAGSDKAPDASAAPWLNRAELVLAVCGAHMAGLPLNPQLRERGGRFLRRTRTAACYRLYALADGPPQRPGLARDAAGAPIEVELWTLPAETVASFLQGIAPPLGLGKVELADGSWETGFICEPAALANAREITALGGWRAYLEQQETTP